jgi:hypothetical protein
MSKRYTLPPSWIQTTGQQNRQEGGRVGVEVTVVLVVGCLFGFLIEFEEIIRSPETLINNNETTWRLIRDDNTLHNNRLQNVKAVCTEQFVSVFA